MSLLPILVVLASLVSYLGITYCGGVYHANKVRKERAAGRRS
jgi:hypothetical protein